MNEDVFRKIHKVIIAGSGPAGLTAAIYAARADLEPILLEGQQPGGQLTITTEVENFPGFSDAIMGPELVDSMRRQAERFGTAILPRDIVSVDLSERPFRLKLDGGQTLRTHTLIVATGARARLLGIPSERALMGHGVSACATCDGFFFRGKKVLVVGGGDSAVEEANFLTKFASSVTIVHRRDALRASKIMQAHAQENPKIDFMWNSTITEFLGVEEKKLRAVKVQDTVTGEVREEACDGVFIAIGHVPNTGFLGGQLKLDPSGNIIVNDPRTETSVEGVFAAGDVADKIYRQAITAAGTGCRAAIDVERYLSHKKEEITRLEQEFAAQTM
ncbi:thioredoxin-disulfide reductase [bacterium]|nr:thioredoxin-disulfide reductase [bacterium]